MYRAKKHARGIEFSIGRIRANPLHSPIFDYQAARGYSEYEHSEY